MDNSINNSYIKIKKESHFDSDTESIDIITESYDERQDNKMLQSRMQQSESIPHSIKTEKLESSLKTANNDEPMDYEGNKINDSEKLNNDLKSIFDEIKLPNKDNIHEKLIKAVTKNGISGLNEYKKDIIPKKLSILNSKVASLLEDCSFEGFSSYFKRLMIKFEILDEDNDLYLDISKSMIESLLATIEQFSQSIEIAKFNKLISIIETSTEQSNQIDLDFQSYIKSLLKHINIENESLIIKISECFLKVIENFEDDIVPTTFEEIKTSIKFSNLENPKREFDENLKTNESFKNKFNETSSKIENIVTKSKKIDLTEVKERLKSMPICLERSILKLIFLINLNLSNKNPLDEKILNEFKLTKERLIIEQIDNADLTACLELIGNKIMLKDWKSAELEVNNFLKKIQPLDIFELKFLIEKARKAGELIKNQDIILLLGKTGAGKSTTIQFLAGSKMIKKKVEIENGNFLEYICPDEDSLNQAFKSIVVGYQGSETRYINPITVNLKDLGGFEDRKIIICDAPGFGDTAGPEVDIANGVGIIDAIKGCKSVKPVILSSYVGLGDRGEGIREIAHILVNLVTNIKDHLSSFSYIFTKYPPNVCIHTTLLNIKKIVEKIPDENHDESFNKLFIDILSKTNIKLGIKVESLDPVNHNPFPILSSFIETRAIYEPSKVFRFTMTEKSRSSLNEQINMHQMCIMQAIKRDEYELIKHKLNEIQFLSDCLKEDSIAQKFKDSIIMISNHINDKYNQILASLNANLEQLNKISIEDVEQYRIQLNKFKELEYFKSFDMLASISGLSYALIQNLKIKFDELLNKSKEMDMKSIDLKIAFDNMKLLANTFPEIELKYMGACKFFYEKLENFHNDFIENLKSNELNKIIGFIQIIQNSSENLKDHLDYDRIKKIYFNSIEAIKNHLKQECSSVDETLKKEYLTDNDLKYIDSKCEILENAKDLIGLRSHISKEDLNEIYANLVDKLVEYFEKLNKKIEQLFNQSSFKDMEEIVKQMRIVRTIPIVELKSSEMFYSTIQKIVGCMQQFSNETELLLNSLNEGNENVNYTKIFGNLSILKDAEWINGHKKGTYEVVIKNIREHLIKHSFNLREKLTDFDLNLTNYENLEGANKLFQQIDRMRDFEKIVPDIKQNIESSIDHFKNSLESTLKYIKDTFNAEKNIVNQLEIKLKNLNDIKRNYNSLHSSFIYLKNQNYNSIDNLNKEIINSKNVIENYKNLETELNSSLNENKKNLNSLLDSDNNNFDLLKKIQEIQKQIKNLVLKKNNESLKLDELIKIKSKFNELTSTKSQESIEAKQFISKTKYLNIESLDQEIDKASAEIKQIKQLGKQNVFNRLDAQTAEHSLNYLNACSKHIKIYKSNSATIKFELENYIKLYRQNNLQSEIDDCFNKIISLGTDTNLAFGFAQNLKNRLQECQEIEKFPQLNSLVNSIEIINQLVNKLEQNYLDLFGHHAQHTDNINELKNKIDIVKALSQLDTFVNGKYFKLFQDYQIAMNNEFKDFYKKIIENIDKNEYKEVANQLLQIEDSPINENAYNRIKNSLASSLNELIGKTTTKSIMISNTLETKDIEYIVEQLRKLEHAKTYISGDFDQRAQEKFKSKSYLDSETQDRLNKSINEIQNLISTKILIYLGGIDACIAMNDFNEAENKRAHLSSIRTLLSNYSNTQEIRNKFELIQKKLESIVSKVLNEYENMPLNQYCLNPPRTIIERLEIVSQRNIQYSVSLGKLKENIMSNIRKNLKEASEAKPEEREDLLQLIQSALCSLPPIMRGFLENEVQSVRQTIKSKELGYETEYQRIITSDDIKAIYNFMEKCSNNGMNTFLRLIQDEILKLGITCKENLIKYLEEDNVKGALNKFKKFFEYIKMFGNKMIEIENYFTEIEKHLINKFFRISSALSEIGNTEPDLILKKFEDFSSFIDFKYEFEIEFTINKNNSENDYAFEMLTKIGSRLEVIYSKITKFFLDYQSKYEISMDEFNIAKINDSMNTMKKFDPLFFKIKRFAHSHSMDELLKIDKCKSYKEMFDFTSSQLNNLKMEILNFDLVKGFSEERDLYYKQFTKKLQFLMQSCDLKDNINKDVFNINCFEKEILPFLESKFLAASTEAKKIFDIAYFSKKDFDDFRLNYDNLVTFDKYSRIKDLNLAKLIGEIDTKINKRLDNLQQIVYVTDFSIENVANNLINLKWLADNLPALNEVINQRIDNMLKDFSSKVKEERGIALAKLSGFLEQDTSGIGLTIITEHKIFKGQVISMFNQEIQRHDIHYVLRKLEGDFFDIENIKDYYEKFERLYKQLVKDNLKRLKRNSNNNEILNELVRSIKLLPDSLMKKTNLKTWDAHDRRTLVSLIAHIFALWTLKNAEYFDEMKGVDNVEKDFYLLTPHPGQIVSIFRILGIGYFEEKEIRYTFFDKVKKMTLETKEISKEINDGLKNNLVQVSTGEGKSLILAMASCILSLIGFEVSCACYSDYLSNRDFDSFLPIFNSLGITSKIHYGTFNKICENVINEQGDIRVRVLDLILNKAKTETDDLEKVNKSKILLVDEVDVFFNQDFYGNIYTPLARLKDSSIENLTDYIWKNRSSRLNIKTIESTVEYKTVCNKFKSWESLIKESTKDMLVDVLEYKHDYIVQNDKLGYKEQDGISFDVVYGYKTLFAYYFENEQGQISDESLKENISIGIKCGSFSYAEIPNCFEYIMGVTGTLKTLSKSEWSIVKEVYNIKYSTYMPSVFGENKRSFAKEADVFIENKDDYFIKLREKIDHALSTSDKKSRRAVLVFFDSKKSLLEFYRSKSAQEIRSEIQIITEEVSSSPKEKDMLIKRATTSGQITLLTKVFGRGTDFVCRDHNVIANGGVHVIQTFYSDELSEEIQIMGRTARQGKDGSFGMILLDSELEKYLGVKYRETIEEMRKNKNTYDTLNEERNKLFEMKFVNINESVRAAKAEHINGQKFIEKLNKNEIEWIKQFLNERNIGANGLNDSRTICLMDATGSMGKLLNQAKNTVGTMFERATVILKDHGIPTGSFQMQFAVYRDYDCLTDGLLQYSPWEIKPENLRKFMETITAKGGGDYEEAIEIGLWHANSEHEKNDISQVILIGDAPSKSKAQILEYRQSFLGVEYWKKTKFREMTHYKDEMKKLKDNKIPIHAFYLHDGAKENFKELATETGGRCEFLDINSADSSNVLTNIVTEQILLSVGQNSGRSEELVAAYKEKFSKSYK